jgi:hypothetical protein
MEPLPVVDGLVEVGHVLVFSRECSAIMNTTISIYMRTSHHLEGEEEAMTTA